MRFVNDLWQDEYGLVLSAEAVTVGTIGVLGTVAGLGMAATAVDAELKEYATAIRRLDQSYAFMGHSSCRAYTAGSSYQQQDVEISVQELCADGPTDIQAIHQHVESQRQKSRTQSAKTSPEATTSEPMPVLKNQIDSSDKKVNPENGKGGNKKPSKKKKSSDADRDQE